MPLVTCPDCGAQISDASPACPRCGRPGPGATPHAPPPPPPRKPGLSPAVIVLLAVGGIFVVTILLGIAAAIVIPRLASDAGEPDPQEPVGVEAPAGPELMESEEGRFGIRVDRGRWLRMPPGTLNEEAEFELQHADGEAYALVISERVGMPLSRLRKVVVDNLRSAGPDLRIVREETRVVDGREVLTLVADATVDGLPIRYHGRYYSGDEGTLQVMAWTARNLYDEHRGDIEALLDGVEIYDRAEGAGS